MSKSTPSFFYKEGVSLISTHPPLYIGHFYRSILLGGKTGINDNAPGDMPICVQSMGIVLLVIEMNLVCIVYLFYRG